ncbi:MAG: hypothetical protein DRH34_07880 [Deltaproteobacteria bacterium]|nr:MAG: hypothetical protein DRH34_07880 [Deltaproteobacteria bacterium]RLC15369.1 MAG: hypothetical protein DRH93_19810 [Deltaproteobacteria bacterium]
MKPETIHLCILSHPANLKDVRRVMIDITAKVGMSKEEAGSIILAVDEACSNIIEHSYKNDYTQKIDLTIKLETQFLTIAIIDEGIRFDINSIETRDINEIRPGGLGIYIIKQVMDTVEYSRTPEGKNIIKMIKKLTT